MLNFWKKSSRKKLEEDLYLEQDEGSSAARLVHERTLDTKENKEFVELLSEHNNIPVFKGKVKHAYESKFLKGEMGTCPRCQSHTKRMMSGFPYATDTVPRIMTAPIGHFCTNCPTVILDDDLAVNSIKSGVSFGGVYGVETGYEDLQMFDTLNGEKTLFILEADGADATLDDMYVSGISQSLYLIQQPGLEYFAPKSIPHSNPTKSKAISKKKLTNKSKNKAARKARKRNRKK